MWNSKESNLNEAMGNGGEWLDKSGCYAGTIVGCEIVNSNSTQAKAVKLIVETPIGKCAPVFWFKTKEGADNEYEIKALDRLKFLCKVKEVKPSTQESKTTLPVFVGKEIGMFLEVEKADKGHNYKVKDFYEPKSQKTTDELLGKKEANNFKYWNDKFKTSVPVEKKESAKVEETVEDEFPF